MRRPRRRHVPPPAAARTAGRAVALTALVAQGALLVSLAASLGGSFDTASVFENYLHLARDRSFLVSAAGFVVAGAAASWWLGAWAVGVAWRRGRAAATFACCAALLGCVALGCLGDSTPSLLGPAPARADDVLGHVALLVTLCAVPSLLLGALWAEFCCAGFDRRARQRCYRADACGRRPPGDRGPAGGRLRPAMADPAPLSNRPQSLAGSASHVVLLVHGLGGGPYEVQRLAEGLHRAGLSTHAMLLPGHGLGGWRMPRSAWPDWLEAVDVAHRELCARYERVDLAGFSTGAPLVLALAQERAVAGRLVLLSPFLRVFRPALSPLPTERLLGAVPFLGAVPRRRPPLADAALRREVGRCAGYRTFSLHAARSALALIARVEARLHEVRAPALVVQGRRDTVVDPKGAALLEAGLGGPKRLVYVDSDHLVTLDRAAPLVLEAARAFLLEPGR